MESGGERGHGPAGGVGEGGTVRVLLVSGPDEQTLLGIGRRVVEERLAACINVWGGVRSVYRWEGRVHDDDEAMAILKSTAGRLEGLERRVRELHPYDEPEFLALPVVRGAASYLDWVRASVEPRPDDL